MTLLIVRFLHLAAMALAIGAGLARLLAARAALKRPQGEQLAMGRAAASSATVEMAGWHLAFVMGIVLATMLSAWKLPFVHIKATIALIGAVAATIVRRRARKHLADADKPPTATWETDARASLPALLGSGPLAFAPLVLGLAALAIVVFRATMSLN